MHVLDTHKLSSATAYVDDFKALTEKLCRMFEMEGVHCKPYVEGLPHFRNMEVSEQKYVVDNLRFYVELCLEQMLDGFKLSDNLSFTWRAFRKLHFVPRSDLFNEVTDSDVLEIYSKDMCQLYRNLRFYEHCSYSLEELYCLKWWTLFQRDEKITQSLMESVTQVLSGESEGNVYPNVGPHIVQELSSEAKLVNRYEPRLLSPLFCNKKVEGLFVVMRLAVLDN